MHGCFNIFRNLWQKSCVLWQVEGIDAAALKESCPVFASGRCVGKHGGLLRQLSQHCLCVGGASKRKAGTGDEQAAFAVAAAWLQRAVLNGSLGSFFNPPLTPKERGVAKIEG
jgi:hypothetical protein